MKDLFGGGKTVVGMIAVVVGAVLGYLGHPDLAKLVMSCGAGLGTVGVAHKIQKLVSK